MLAALALNAAAACGSLRAQIIAPLLAASVARVHRVCLSLTCTRNITDRVQEQQNNIVTLNSQNGGDAWHK